MLQLEVDQERFAFLIQTTFSPMHVERVERLPIPTGARRFFPMLKIELDYLPGTSYAKCGGYRCESQWESK